MVTASQLRQQIRQKRAETVRVDRAAGEELRESVRLNPTAPSSKFDPIRQRRQSTLNRLTGEITALEELERQLGRQQAEISQEELNRITESAGTEGVRGGERSIRRDTSRAIRREEAKLQATSLSPENIAALEEARLKRGQLSPANIRALQADIDLRGLGPEGEKLLKKAGLDIKPRQPIQRAGETTLEFRERIDPELQFSMKQTEIPQTKVGTSAFVGDPKDVLIVDPSPGKFPVTKAETEAFAESEFFKDASLSSKVTPLGVAGAAFAGASAFFEDFIDTTIKSKAPPITQGFIPNIFEPSDKVEPFGARLGDVVLSKGQFESNVQQITEIRKIRKAEADFQKDVGIIQKEFQEDPESFKGKPGFSSEKTEEGVTFTLTPEFFKDLPSFKEIERLQARVDEQGFLKREEVTKGLVLAREQFKTLSKEQRALSVIGDFEVPFLKIGASLPEVGRDVAFTFGKQFSRVGAISSGITGFPSIKETFTTRQLNFGSNILKVPVAQSLKEPFTLGSLPEMVVETPGSTAQSILMAGLALKAGGFAKPITVKPFQPTFGGKAKTFLGQTIGKIQPIRIADRNLIITDIAREFRERPKGGGIRTVQVKEGGRITTITQGETQDVSFNIFGKKQGGIQFFGTKEQKFADLTKSQVDFRLATPFARIGPGGTLSFGRTTITSKGIITTVPVSGNIFQTTGEIKISGPQIATQTRFINTFGGGVQTGQLGPIETFRFFSGPKITQFVEDPSRISFLEVKPRTFEAESGFFVDVKGKGIRFTIPEDPGTFFKTFFGRTKTSLDKTFGPDATQVQVTKFFQQPKNFQPLFTKVEVSSEIPGAVPGVTSPSQFGFGQTFISQFPSTSTVFAPSFVPVFQSSALFTPTSFSLLAPFFISDTQKDFQLTTTSPSLSVKTLTRTIQIPKQDPLTGQTPGQGQPQAQLPAQKQVQIPQQVEIPKQVPVTIPRITQPTITVPVTVPIIAKFPFAGGIIKPKVKAIAKAQGYDALAKQRGKFVKLNKVPLTKAKARDLMAFIVDTSLSATGRIKKANKPAKKSNLRIPGGYYRRTADKFRQFKIAGKKRIPLKNTYIEKKRFRLDFKNETRSIVAARRSLSKPKRRKK